MWIHTIIAVGSEQMILISKCQLKREENIHECARNLQTYFLVIKSNFLEQFAINVL